MLGTAILCNGEVLLYSPEYLIQYLPVCMPLQIPPRLQIITVVDRYWQESDLCNNVN
jgi:hypothetical protein